MKIKEILTIDLSEDIKNVIDLEDISENEIQTEIENYIVTDGLAKEYADFVDIFTSNIRESGVWISGFYGSGKSYFGKLLGYLIGNRMINGTPARERILQRFSGVKNEALIKNSISSLESTNVRVVMLDIAKQDTTNGLSFTLFKNFLKTLSLPQNEHGVFLYQMMISENKVNVQEYISNNLNKNWSELESHLFRYVDAIKKLYIGKGNSEEDYNNLIATIRRSIDEFDASKLKQELDNYFKVAKDEKVVFLFDEASEALNQKKFNLLDLEGLSESLSALGGRVWTIAIAQEKLDDVINNANVSKAQLTKVTDRFKTKIHLEATEVDVIIRSRLLNKNDEGLKLLIENYKNNSGKIADHASITGGGIHKTDNAENYATYYPFYKYQFDLLQNFLFGVKGYASTKVAARGMIITTYDVLRQEIQHQELFNTVTGWHIAKEAQPQPPVRLVNRYDNAERILKDISSPISGRKLLETINFLTESEVTPATIFNIAKSFISHPDEFHKTKGDIEKSLEELTKAKILLDTNNIYRITSDIEQRLLDEMNSFTVQGFIKKNELIKTYKNSGIIKSISKINDNNLNYDFHITSDNDDELSNHALKLKHLKLKVKSLYNISDDRANDIDILRTQTQNDKDTLWLVPNNEQFREIDQLLDEIERIGHLEQKYNNPVSDEGKILASFSTTKSEKQNRVKDLIDRALSNGTTVYLYNALQLNKDNWQTTIQQQQRSIVKNVYSNRLSAQMSDNVAASIIKEANGNRLHQYFASSEFKFFDNQGNFIGDNLKVVEEILYKIRNTFVDGQTLEKELEVPPTGFTFGTVMSSLSALMRAGKVMAKYNGSEKFSWRDEGVATIFSTAREFRKASFKAVLKSLTALQKQSLAQILLDIELEKHTGSRIDYNTNDFELVCAIRDLAKHFSDKISTLGNSEKDFHKLFPKAASNANLLNSFTGIVSEANYIDKANHFFSEKESYLISIQEIEKIEKFMRSKLPSLRKWKEFVTDVNEELTKAAKENEIIAKLQSEFKQLMNGDILKNYSDLQNRAQKTKDEYHNIFSKSTKECAEKYKDLLKSSEYLISEIESLPDGLNNESLKKAKVIKQYAQQRISDTISLEFDVKDKKSHFTYSEVLSFIEIFPSKEVEISIIQSSLIREEAQEVPQAPASSTSNKPATTMAPVVKKYSVKLPKTNIKVVEYRRWLKDEMRKLASANDNDEIEIN